MSKFKYVSSSGVAIELDGADLFTGNAQNARGYEWRYSIRGNRTASHRRDARDLLIPFYALDMAEADRLRGLSDMDMENSTPGTFVVNGEWSQSGYITALDIAQASNTSVIGTMKIVLLDGFWWSIRTYKFEPRSVSGSGSDLDYPHDYPHDFAYFDNSGVVDVPGILSADVLLTIYGPVDSPTVFIGGNAYTVNASVPYGGKLVVDGKAKTANVIVDGEATNVFSGVVRGSGLGSGSYGFEPLKSGENAVSWNNNFAFDVGFYVQSSEPYWSGA